MSFLDYIKPIQKQVESLESFSQVKAVKKPLYVVDDSTQYKQIEHYGVQVGDEVVYIGKNYEIIQNEDVANEILNFIKSTSYQVHNIRSVNNRRFDVTLVDQNAIVTIGNEPAYKTAIITNSYDGSARFSVTFGVNIQICGNGARATKPVDGLVFKHTNNQIDFSRMYKSADTLDRVLEKFNQSWDLNGEVSRANFNKLTAIFPKKTNGDQHDLSTALAMKAHEHVTENNYPPNFALFMAVTNMTTYPDRYNMSDNYALRLEQKTTEVFF